MIVLALIIVAPVVIVIATLVLFGLEAADREPLVLASRDNEDDRRDADPSLRRPSGKREPGDGVAYDSSDGTAAIGAGSAFLVLSAKAYPLLNLLSDALSANQTVVVVERVVDPTIEP